MTELDLAATVGQPFRQGDRREHGQPQERGVVAAYDFETILQRRRPAATSGREGFLCDRARVAPARLQGGQQALARYAELILTCEQLVAEYKDLVANPSACPST